MLVSVCICTFRRPFVAETISSILSQEGSLLSNLEIIICDDDPAQSAKDMVAALASNTSAAIKYVVSGAGNIAVCRNTCLAIARGDLIAFIDDDETAEPNWLSELLSAQVQFGADVVKGYVSASYPAGAPGWILAGDPFTRDCGPTGMRLSVFGTGNVLFRRAFATDHNIVFDPSYGRTGGEDTDFFRRFDECRARMVACRTAIVNEIVPPTRLTKSYLMHRNRRTGHAYARTFFDHRSFASQLCAVARSTVGVTLCAPYGLARLAPGALPFRMFAKFWFHFGVLEWAMGRISPTLE